jgi:hypothetical protein
MKYLYELTKGYQLYGQAWVPIHEAISYLKDVREWISKDAPRLLVLVKKLSKCTVEEREVYNLIYLDFQARLVEYYKTEQELVTFIGQSFEELLLSDANGLSRVKHDSNRSGRKTKH